MGRHDHAATDRLAVQPLAISEAVFDGMTEGMTKIEDGTQTGLAFILPHDPGLDLTTAFDGMGQRLRIPFHQ